jgi:hypothetical protein
VASLDELPGIGIWSMSRLELTNYGVTKLVTACAEYEATSEYGVTYVR